MNIDNLIEELEDAYWLTVNNKADDYVRRLTFANYQFIVASYLVKGEEPKTEYLKIHNHFYNYECKKEKK